MAVELTVRDVLRMAVDSAHQVLESTVADVDDELANRPAPGSANPVGSLYAHLVFAEDHHVNEWFMGKEPLYATSWKGRTGVDKQMPVRGEGGDLGEWYRTASVDMAALREYAKAVYANTQQFIANADDATLTREIRSPQGPMALAAVFSTFIVGHCNNVAGEISAIKGTFGRKGYPF